jgi:hypothetical protein
VVDPAGHEGRGGVRSWCGLALSAALAAAGCARSAPATADVSMHWTLASHPPTVGPAALTLSLSGPDRRPVLGARLKVEGTMSHPGMAPVFADAEDLGQGRYRVPLHFTMAGDWILLVSGTLPGGRTIERRIDVAGVRPAA